MLFTRFLALLICFVVSYLIGLAIPHLGERPLPYFVLRREVKELDGQTRAASKTKDYPYDHYNVPAIFNEDIWELYNASIEDILEIDPSLVSNRKSSASALPGLPAYIIGHGLSRYEMDYIVGWINNTRNREGYKVYGTSIFE
jgi:hypothetical protein